MSVRSTIIPPKSMNSGSGGRSLAKSLPRTDASNGTGSSTRPDNVAPSSVAR